MKILVTGGTGFVGRFLLPLLVDAEHEVHSMEQYFFASLDKTNGAKKVYLANICDSFAVRNIMKKVNPDVVIHLAAMTAVAYSYEHPHETTMSNLIGTINMAEIARLECSNLKQFIYPSSAEVYGVNKIPIKKETDPLLPNSPYAVAKEASERYLWYMHAAYNFPVTVFRPFNSYGRKRSHFFVIEKTIWQMVRGQPICYLGDPEPVRDFLHIEDHAEAYMKALNNPNAIGDLFNLSTGVGISIRDLAEKIRKLTKFTGHIKWRTIPPRPLDIMHLVGSNDKLRKILGVPEPVSLENGLKKTIKYWGEKIERENDWHK
jgi:nucleoside-diphosphate-sugar epimerase